MQQGQTARDTHVKSSSYRIMAIQSSRLPTIPRLLAKSSHLKWSYMYSHEARFTSRRAPLSTPPIGKP
eukprot:3403839-Karenia_brevis.AAC.1